MFHIVCNKRWRLTLSYGWTLILAYVTSYVTIIADVTFHSWLKAFEEKKDLEKLMELEKIKQ